MSTLWTDLLFLHGYITDHKLVHRLANETKSSPHKAHRKETAHAPRTKHVHYYARLCLGIGDGVIHVQ
jgi:hypothetical protein